MWPQEPDGQGPSLELHNPGMENMVASSWRSSYSNGGTPGKSNNSILISGIYINEFLASNDAVHSDEYKEFDDWIELYNSTEIPVNIGGLYITDKLEDPFKHHIPNHNPEATTIPAGGFLLLWADGEENEGILHLNFKLNQAGEQIGLVQFIESKATYIDSLTYGWQDTDISFGRFTDGSESWYSLAEPTPLQSNILTSIKKNDYPSNSFELFQNYPNPFHSNTIIRYQLSAFTDVELSVYDLIGRKVTTLVSETKQSGNHEVEWNAGGLQPGIYFCELKTSRGRQVMKMILID